MELGGSSLLFCKDVYTELLEKSAGLYWEKEQADCTEDLYCDIRIFICEEFRDGECCQQTFSSV